MSVINVYKLPSSQGWKSQSRTVPDLGSGTPPAQLGDMKYIIYLESISRTLRFCPLQRRVRVCWDVPGSPVISLVIGKLVVET